MAEVAQGGVSDDEGNDYNTRLVLPRSAQSLSIKSDQGSSAPRDAQRRAATDRFLPALAHMPKRSSDVGAALNRAGKQGSLWSNAALTDSERAVNDLQELWSLQRPRVPRIHTRRLQQDQHGGAASREELFTENVAAHTHQRRDGVFMQLQRLPAIREAN